MSGELKHKDVGASLSRNDWEAINVHELDSGALGDMIYHDGVNLTRLPLPTAPSILAFNNAIPYWSKKSSYHSIADYGATMGGSADDSTAWLATIAAAVADETGILVPKGTSRITSNVTIPKGCLLMVEGSIDVAAGIVLTINGGIQSNPTKHIFVGTGSVVFTNNNVIYPQWWGAKADGVTDDTVNLQKCFDAAPGQYVRMLPGKYVVSATYARYVAPHITGAICFPLKSNIVIDGMDSASVALGLPLPSTLGMHSLAIFGADSMDPVSPGQSHNVTIRNLEIYCDFDAAANNPAYPIRLYVGQDPALDTEWQRYITNWTIRDCKLHDCASAVHVNQRTAWRPSGGQDTRHSRFIKILNNHIYNVRWSGVTLDGEDVIFQGNLVQGWPGNTGVCYDGVSMHCGRRVKILDNYFEDFGHANGFAINCRNSHSVSENQCGAHGIIIRGNTIENCTCQAAIVINTGKLSGTAEPVFGVRYVLVEGNFVNVSIRALEINRGGDPTPWGPHIIRGNIFRTSSHQVAHISSPLPNPMYDLTIDSNQFICNSVNEVTDQTSFDMFAPYRCKVNNNFIFANVPAISPRKAVEVERGWMSSFTNNTFFCSDTTIAGRIKVFDGTDCMWSGNIFQGQTDIDSTSPHNFITNNRFLSAAVIRGRVIASLAVAEYDGLRMTTKRSSAPGSGTWAVGDTVINTAPAAGGEIGWVCVGAGTPGTWKSYGTIAV